MVASSLGNHIPEKINGEGETTANTVTSSIVSVEEEMVIKHMLNVSIQSFDVICVAEPLLSSISVFTGSLHHCIGVNREASKDPTLSKQQQTLTSQQLPSSEASRNIVTWPITIIRCDSVRLIMPYGDTSTTDYLNDDEHLLLLHLHSLDVTSSPVNPVTKTVVDKQAYQQLKQCYREAMKKLKLWNVQYQLDITNIGLCTTNWKSVQSSLPDNKNTLSGDVMTVSSQNPAVEWNSQLT